MSGIGFWEMIFLCLIGLVVLGPKRLPEVASQLGSWVGQARRMTRVLKRQLEEELDFEKELNIHPSATYHPPPRDDDTYSPLHEQPQSAGATLDLDEPGDTDAEPAGGGAPPEKDTIRADPDHVTAEENAVAAADTTPERVSDDDESERDERDKA
jgi:sec-independent protein translocase protein TatB